MRSAPETCGSARIATPRLLLNAATVMGELVRLVENIEEAIFDDSGTQVRLADSPALHQDIDLISQTISEISALLFRLAKQTPADSEITLQDIIAPIRLERLRHLIADGAGGSVAEKLKPEPQEIDLFN